MNLDLDKAADRVGYWQSVYKLAEWDIYAQSGLPKEAGEDAAAYVKTEPEYLRAYIHFSETLDMAQIDETACHEVAHVLLADFGHWASTALQYVGRGEEGPLNDAWTLAWERTTERVSRLVRGMARKEDA